MTIEERAKGFAYQVDYQIHKDDLTEVEQSIRACGVSTGYIQGATDQQEIDIQKALEWLKLNVSEYLLENFYGEKYIETDYLVKEFEQAMKG